MPALLWDTDLNRSRSPDDFLFRRPEASPLAVVLAVGVLVVVVGVSGCRSTRWLKNPLAAITSAEVNSSFAINSSSAIKRPGAPKVVHSEDKFVTQLDEELTEPLVEARVDDVVPASSTEDTAASDTHAGIQTIGFADTDSSATPLTPTPTPTDPTNSDPRVVRPDLPQPEAPTVVPLDEDDDEAAADVIHQLTLNQIIFASLNEHPTISAGLELIEQTRADYLTASLFPNPELFTDVQLLPLTRPFTVTRQGGPPQQDAILTYPIDWFLFGKRTAAMTAAHSRIHVSQAEFEDLIRQRVLLTATAFYDALEAQAILKLARESVQNLQQIEDITEQAVKDGGRPEVELSRVRLDLLANKQVLRTSVANSIGAEARLKAVVGRLGEGTRLRPPET